MASPSEQGLGSPPGPGAELAIAVLALHPHARVTRWTDGSGAAAPGSAGQELARFTAISILSRSQPWLCTSL